MYRYRSRAVRKAIEVDGIGEIEVAYSGVDEGVGRIRYGRLGRTSLVVSPDTAYWVIPLVESCECGICVAVGEEALFARCDGLGWTDPDAAVWAISKRAPVS